MAEQHKTLPEGPVKYLHTDQTDTGGLPTPLTGATTYLHTTAEVELHHAKETTRGK